VDIAGLVAQHGPEEQGGEGKTEDLESQHWNSPGQLFRSDNWSLEYPFRFKFP
jgi:hypothetical protein